MSAFVEAVRAKAGDRVNGRVLGIGSIARECEVSPAQVRALLSGQFNPAFFAVCKKLLKVEANIFLIKEESPPMETPER
jgi:hypothetical protein